jgi:hypothetical protein
MRRALAAALLAVASALPLALGANVPAPNALVQRYLTSLQRGAYGDAFALLAPAERAYFRSPANFASGFTADAYALRRFALTAARTSPSGTVVLARERIALTDPAHDVRVTTVVTVPYLIVGAGASARVIDAGRPWRAFASDAVATAAGVRVTVKKLALYAHAIRVVVTMQNDGNGFITVLPYGRSVLRDDAGGIYRPLITRDWTVTDEQLFLGLRLAPNSRYTGTLAFATPLLDDRARRFALTLGPSVRDGAGAPVSVDVAGIAARS